MKKVLTTIICLIIIASTNAKLFGQYTQQKEIIETVEVDSLSKSELYQNAKKWILSRFMTSDNIVEFDDENNETINVTGHILMDKLKFMQGAMGYFVKTSGNTITFKLRIDFKEGKFRYTFSNMIYSFDQIGGPNEGYVQNPLYEITDLPKNKIAQVNAEADEKLSEVISELKEKISYNTTNDDW